MEPLHGKNGPADESDDRLRCRSNETLEEKHRRQGEEFVRLLEFERALPERLQSLSQTERLLLHLEQESHLSEDGRQYYLMVLEQLRPIRHKFNLDLMNLSWPDADDDSG